MSQNKEIKFLSLTKDIVFKTLWYKGDKDVRRFLERMLEYSIGNPIGKYDFGPNEQGILTYEQIANKVDILLVSKDKKYYLNVEMNRLNKEKSSLSSILASENKSNIYLANLAANFYNALNDKYKTEIRVEQVNFNAYYYPYNKSISKLDYELYDSKKKIKQYWLKPHQLYLPRLRDICYNQGTRREKDFALLLSENYEEMEELAKDDKEREKVVKFVKKLGRDKEFMCIIDREEYERIQFEIYKEEALEEALEQGIEQGIEQGLEKGIEQGIEQGKKKNKIEFIKSMYKNEASLDFIAKCAKTSIKDVKNILQIN